MSCRESQSPIYRSDSDSRLAKSVRAETSGTDPSAPVWEVRAASTYTYVPSAVSCAPTTVDSRLVDHCRPVHCCHIWILQGRAMHLLYYSLALVLPALAAAAAAEDSKKAPVPFCTIRSPTSGAFFDLNPIHIQVPSLTSKKSSSARNESWAARGYDYGANFTLNFCGPVIENLTNVVGVDENRWQNVSAFYQLDGKTFSIGCVSAGIGLLRLVARTDRSR